jgi:hypothetical protein
MHESLIINFVIASMGIDTVFEIGLFGFVFGLALGFDYPSACYIIQSVQCNVMHQCNILCQCNIMCQINAIAMQTREGLIFEHEGSNNTHHSQVQT